ncbi:polymeric immunoglobulin receptor isoform X2 [Fundulus heteroclitus]|uniref:polymeric immunoglobulin receptor isoform X1 n=1 Tax=Fundulus heteroclitus TaxID=8078 RepID=UPI00165B7097|nr:polymeric immunoglobulin receptor isoform X1 [Fundulus heteroclitus]XP_035998970.1 polymeric immunoglobulin receptor isoform X2 [Fundulus heteroclitus]
MNFHTCLLCLVFSLQVRDSRAVDALKQYGVSGENVTHPCLFILHGMGNKPGKIFCRETCEGENLLVETSDDTAQNGRYRTKYVRETSKTYSVLSVSISGLNWFDSGLYRCGLGDSSSSASYQDFRLVVVDALLDGNKDHHFYKEAGSSLTVACFFKYTGKKRLFSRGGPGDEEVLVRTDGERGERGRYSLEYDRRPSGGVLLVTITQLTQSDSGRYRCTMDRTFLPDLHRDFSISVTNAADPSTSTPTTTDGLSSSSGSVTNLSRKTLTSSDNPSRHNVLLMVLTLTISINLLYVALLVFCRKTRGKAQTAPDAQMEQTSETEAGTIYENLSEEVWRCADVAIHSGLGEDPNGRATGADRDDDSISLLSSPLKEQRRSSDGPNMENIIMVAAHAQSPGFSPSNQNHIPSTVSQPT